MIEDRGDNGPAILQGQTEYVTDLTKELPGAKEKLVGMTSVFRANVPSIYVDVNRRECMSKEVALKDLFDTMRIYLGSLYVNDFNLFGRTWQVVVQADQKFRNKVDDVRRLKVRNAEGGMVPVSALADVKEVNGPLVLTRYNMYPAAPLSGSAAPGVSSGEAIRIVEDLARDNLLGSMSYEWTELAYLEIQAGNTAMMVFGAAVVMVFLVLAAQYESWSLPMAVILVVPMCLLSGVSGVKVSYQDINIFTQIGFVVLVGLASKNAILIVEFAKHLRERGEPPRRAALDACALRFRPIVMTSFAFILGVVPLILSQGAGAEMRRTLGITVFSGMLGVTVFGVFLTPVFFVVIDRLGSTRVLQSKTVQWVCEGLAAAAVIGLARVFFSGLVWPVTAGLVWILYRQMQQRTRALPRGAASPAAVRVTPGADGHGNGNGSVDGGGPGHAADGRAAEAAGRE
jgi:multidrug efflux pump